MSSLSTLIDWFRGLWMINPCSCWSAATVGEIDFRLGSPAQSRKERRHDDHPSGWIWLPILLTRHLRSFLPRLSMLVVKVSVWMQARSASCLSNSLSSRHIPYALLLSDYTRILSGWQLWFQMQLLWRVRFLLMATGFTATDAALPTISSSNTAKISCDGTSYLCIAVLISGSGAGVEEEWR